MQPSSQFARRFNNFIMAAAQTLLFNHYTKHGWNFSLPHQLKFGILWDPPDEISWCAPCTDLSKKIVWIRTIFFSLFVFSQMLYFELFFSKLTTKYFYFDRLRFPKMKITRSLEACESTFQLLGGDGFFEICLSFARGNITLCHWLTHLSVVSQHVCSSRPSPPPPQHTALHRQGCCSRSAAVSCRD